MRSLLLVITLAVCTCLPGKYLSAQRVVVSIERSGRYIIDLSAGNCTPSPWTKSCNMEGTVASIALIHDTLYSIAGGILYQHSFMEPLTTCGKYLNGLSSDVLTVDKKGMVYWVSNSLLIRLNPYIHVLDTLGTLPFAATGDMIFYKDRLYLSATGGIAEINTANPSQSRMVIPAPGREFPGLVNVQNGCSGNKVYAIEFVNGINNVIELDLEQNRILGVFCSFNMNGQKVIDAASFFETGAPPAITIRNLKIKPACLPGTDQVEITLDAYSPEGDSSLLCLFTKGGSQRVEWGAQSPTLPMVFKKQMIPGTWNLQISDHNGCTKDTLFAVPEPISIQAVVNTQPDTCGTGKGTATVQVINGVSPYDFALEGVGSQTTPVFSSLQSGDYRLRFKDSTTCTADLKFTIGAVRPPYTPIIDLTIVPAANCMSGGEIKITYRPSANVSGSRLGDSAFQAGGHFTNVPAGTHRLQIQMGTCMLDTTITMPALPGVAPVIRFSNRNADCNGGGGSSTIQVSGSSPPFTISFNSGNFTSAMRFDNLTPGVYPVVVKDGNGCEWKVSDTILPYQLVSPLIDSAVSNNPCQGVGSIKLGITGTEGPYRFEVGGSLYNSGMQSVDLVSGTYPVTIYNDARCAVDTIQFKVPAKANCDSIHAIYVPSAFTPNADGKNDILEPLGNPLGKVTHFIFRVYNRSGQMVFESRTPGKGWDGKYKGIQQPSATYVWLFQGTDPDGKPVNYKGTTVLIR